MASPPRPLPSPPLVDPFPPSDPSVLSRRENPRGGSPVRSFMPCMPSAGRDSPSSQVDSFNPHHAQYSCCFQHLHAQSGSMIVSLCHIIGALLFFVYVVKSFSREDKSLVDGIFQILFVFLIITANLVFLIGLRIEHRHIVSFFICFQTCLICFFFVIFLCLILGWKTSIIKELAVVPNGKHSIVDRDGTTHKQFSIEQELFIVAQIFVSFGIVFIEVWFLTVFLKSFRYLNDKYNFTGSDAAEV